MSELPLHIAVLDKLLSNVEKRLDVHRMKTGNGLEDREYQRHVGRIHEGQVLVADIKDLRKQLINDEDIDEPESAGEQARKRRRSK